MHGKRNQWLLGGAIMKKHELALFGFATLLLMCGLGLPSLASAQVNISIAIPLPGLVIPAPPATVVVPGTNVFYPPAVQADIFFYHGYWYRPYRGQWFISVGYSGPWSIIAINRMPRPLLRMPPHFAHAEHVHKHAFYGPMRRSSRSWEQSRY